MTIHKIYFFCDKLTYTTYIKNKSYCIDTRINISKLYPREIDLPGHGYGCKICSPSIRKPQFQQQR